MSLHGSSKKEPGDESGRRGGIFQGPVKILLRIKIYSRETDLGFKKKKFIKRSGQSHKGRLSKETGKV